jgi:hypothetical protein
MSISGVVPSTRAAPALARRTLPEASSVTKKGDLGKLGQVFEQTRHANQLDVSLRCDDPHFSHDHLPNWHMPGQPWPRPIAKTSNYRQTG